MCPLYVFENMKVLDTALFKVFSPILGFPFINFKHLVKNYPSRYFFSVASLKISSCCLCWSHHSVPTGKQKGIQRRVPKM